MLSLRYFIFQSLLLCLCTHTFGSPFEIKVHDELIADYLESAYEIESNVYQTSSLNSLKGDVFQSRFEYGFGITPHSELGLNIYASRYDGVSSVNGGKISHMYIPTHDEKGWLHYGLKNEINYIKDVNGLETTFYELTPIIAIQLQKWRFTFNPSIDATLIQDHKTTFSPSAKIAYHCNKELDLGSEYYADNLDLKDISVKDHSHSAYAVLDLKLRYTNLNLGVGKGLNTMSDIKVIKMIASFAF
jgi:hypothetical protein